MVEAMKLDEADDLAKALAGMGMEDSSPDGGEENENDDRNTEGGGFEPPPSDVQILQHFGPLEKYASKSGLGEAGFFLQKARMLMIEAHASKPARQTDVREFFES